MIQKELCFNFQIKYIQNQPYNNKQRNYTAFRLRHRNIMGIGSQVGYDAVKQLSSRIQSIQKDLKQKQYGVGVTVNHQVKVENMPQLIKALKSAKIQSQGWRSQSQGWTQQSKRWSENLLGIVCLLIGFALIYFVIQMIYGSSGTNVERQGILNERKIQMETVIHEKIDKLLKKHKNKLKNGSIQINHQFELKDFGFKDYKAQASLKLRLYFINNQMKHEYQITGYLQGEIVLSEKKGDYVVSVDSSPGQGSFILDIIWLPFKIIGSIVRSIWWLLDKIIEIILVIIWLLLKIIGFFGLLLLIGISLKALVFLAISLLASRIPTYL